MKNSSSEKFFYLIAIMAVCGFHALLFVLFRFETPEKGAEDQNIRHLANVTMLPIEKNPALPWQANLIASLELLDPTVLSLPNTSYGFSNVRSLEFERPFSEITAYDMAVELTPAPPFSPIQIGDPVDDLIHAVNSKSRLEIASDFHDVSPPTRVGSNIYWTNADGTILDRLPSVSLSKETDDDKQLITSGPTQLQVILVETLVRVRLLGSCGNPQLDEIAVKTLRRYFLAEQSKSTTDVKTNYELDGGNSVIYAHWRFASEVSETVNLNAEDLPDDWNRF